MVLHRRDLWSAVCEVLPLFLVTDYSAPRGLVLRSQLSILFSELIESSLPRPKSGTGTAASLTPAQQPSSSSGCDCSTDTQSFLLALHCAIPALLELEPRMYFSDGPFSRKKCVFCETHDMTGYFPDSGDAKPITPIHQKKLDWHCGVMSKTVCVWFSINGRQMAFPSMVSFSYRRCLRSILLTPPLPPA